MSNMDDLNKLRHSASHLMAAAVLKLWPKALPAIGPAIENGFYYDFDNLKVSEDDFPKIEKVMGDIANNWSDFEKIEVDGKSAIEQFRNNPYKKELIEEFENSNEQITLYKSGDFTDLCSGGHIDTPNEKLKFFKLLSVAGAYWRGNENNKMLTRIYGTAFFTQKELDEYLNNLKEAEKRDHRKLGKEMDLYHIDEKVGLGLPLWHPKGAILWRVIEDFWYEQHLKSGYELVRTPHIGNSNLWKTSGHLDFYSSSMYPPLEVGQALEEKQQGKKIVISEEYYLKPMNCPFHLQIYNSSPKSYRDLPLRWAECGTVYRFEKTGELSGLTRVRGFTQDDAHIICREDQVVDELKKVIDFILIIYKSFGFESDSIHVFLSLRDPENKTKYAGDDKGWNFTEDVLRKVAKECKLNFTEEKGEAAFYGPKLDFKIKDALGRLWQCSTLQFDFNLPTKFGIVYTNSDGKKETPYMLHRALFGSYERFIGLLIEHYAGNFPTWLTPVQVKVLPITEKQLEYAKSVVNKLKAESIRVEFDGRNEPLGGKIRDAQQEKVSYMLIVGEKESNSKTVSERGRSGKDYGQISLEKFIRDIRKEIAEKIIN